VPYCSLLTEVFAYRMLRFLFLFSPLLLQTLVTPHENHVIKKRLAWHDGINLFWAENCDFSDNDIGNVQIEGPQCGPKCASTVGCTHFTWTRFNGGTCWLKTNPVSQDQTIPIGEYSVCGVIKNPIPPTTPTRGPPGATPGKCPDGWEMVKKFSFSDMNTVRNDWDIMQWNPGFVNEEKQRYTNDARNIFSRNGHLIVKAFRDGDSFTSGRLHSKQKFTPFDVPSRKLRVEFTGKVPTSMGGWPAYWMMGIDSTYGGWPRTGEIDIMEWVQQISGTYQSTNHWLGSGTHRSRSVNFNLSPDEMKNNYITYGVEYSAVPNDEYIQYYFRRANGEGMLGQKFDKNVWSDFQCANKQAGRFPCSTLAPFDNNMYLIINLAVGGTWGGAGVSNYDAFNGGVEMETSDVTVCKKL